LRTAHGGHGAEAIGGQQHLIAHTGVHGIERHHGVAPIAPVEVERLHQQELPSLVRRVFLGSHQFANDPRDQHGLTLSHLPPVARRRGFSLRGGRRRSYRF